MKLLAQRVIAAGIALSLSLTSVTLSAQTPPKEDLEPKFIWGLLLNIVLPRVGMALLDWGISKMTAKLDNASFTSLTKKSVDLKLEPLPPVVMASGEALGYKENVVAGEPSKDFKIENGKENFQGLIVSMAVFDASGKPLEFRPITSDFRTGEKFKLRVLSTFEGHFFLNAINPAGAQSKLYPSQDQSIRIPAGQEVLIPPHPDQFFQFHGSTGKEKLVVIMRDSKLDGSNLPLEPVFRKDENFGSLFVQEVTGGKLPLIVQSISLNHK